MIAESVARTLRELGVDFFAGVPDSLLAGLSDALDAETISGRHVVAVNEGAAVSMASGHFLATASVGFVYFQNSGLGNSINPLISLAHSAVYSIPIILMIGWRGSPGHRDEPQHLSQGEATTAFLDALGIPWKVFSSDSSRIKSDLTWAKEEATVRQSPVALLVEPKTFTKAAPGRKEEKIVYRGLSREGAIRQIIRSAGNEVAIVASTGMISRELLMLRQEVPNGAQQDFLNVGAMGHASSIALAIALARKETTVLCIDGDGAALMHMGVLATIGDLAPPNLIHVVLNNQAHDSVGGYETVAREGLLAGLAKECGYPNVASSIQFGEEIALRMSEFRDSRKLSFMEVMVAKGSRPDLPRPDESLIAFRNRFMNFLGNESRPR